MSVNETCNCQFVMNGDHSNSVCTWMYRLVYVTVTMTWSVEARRRCVFILWRQGWMTILWCLSCCIGYITHTCVEGTTGLNVFLQLDCGTYDVCCSSQVHKCPVVRVFCFARICETCFNCKVSDSRHWRHWRFLPETENCTISVCFLHGFGTGDKVPGLNFVVAGVRLTTGTPVILVQFLHCFTQLQAKMWRLYFESGHGPCVPHQLFTVIPW